jgi:diaminopimelate epimerase
MGLKKVAFTKVEGSGNDFILVDGRDHAVSWNREGIRRLCDRNRGIGSDGLLYIDSSEPSRSGAIRVHYWNADGGPAAFCGNGARCIAAHLMASEESHRLEFRLGAVEVRATHRGGDVFRVSVDPPVGKDLELSPAADLGPTVPKRGVLRMCLVVAGVPHLVLLAAADLFRKDAGLWGPPLRMAFHKEEDGVNVDLVHEGEESWRLRTFERGVERETLSCGSGILAAGWCLRAWGVTELPVTLVPTGGEELTVGKDASDGRWFLEGPARIVYRGDIPWPLPAGEDPSGNSEEGGQDV